MTITLGELNDIMRKCEAQEYTMFMSYFPGTRTAPCRITLEKGSSYSGVHMKVEGQGATPTEAFEKALANFPANPANGHWDSFRLAKPEEAVEGEFTEILRNPPENAGASAPLPEENSHDEGTAANPSPPSHR